MTGRSCFLPVFFYVIKDSPLTSYSGIMRFKSVVLKNDICKTFFRMLLLKNESERG